LEYVRLGKSGLKVSRLCLGCMSYGSAAQGWHAWVLDEEQSRPLIRRALELGINFFDTANIYSSGTSEEILGRALKDFARREEVVIATKVYGAMGKGANERGLSRKHVLSEIDASLRRLGTDYIDLYQIHRLDEETPIEEILSTLDAVVRSGKARYIGASSMAAWQFAKMLYTADLGGWTRFVSMQPHYNLLYREEEREMLPLCRDQGIGVIPWSPLARGLVIGNRGVSGGGETARAQSDPYTKKFYVEGDLEIVERLTEVAQARGAKNVEVALAWHFANPAVTAPIIGATKLNHLEDANAALALKLTPEEMSKLEELYRPHEIRGTRV
jgi:aryl-alcohol dehydrogenase-like predicted oxidoreductase